jgi:hypothetical protein
MVHKSTHLKYETKSSILSHGGNDGIEKTEYSQERKHIKSSSHVLSKKVQSRFKRLVLKKKKSYKRIWAIFKV